jgi:methylenetetrahydrofolate dehydrogenase (NADP+)/methenyltetrahydrofolate cyclohydrolase/formyltetrahydrofolate synthetase
MTIAMLMENTLISAKQHMEGFQKPIEYLALDLKSPVPSDIDISAAQNPKPMRQIAEELGLLESEVPSPFTALFFLEHAKRRES